MTHLQITTSKRKHSGAVNRHVIFIYLFNFFVTLDCIQYLILLQLIPILPVRMLVVGLRFTIYFYFLQFSLKKPYSHVL